MPKKIRLCEKTLRRMLSERAEQSDMAASLGVSVATVQRRLAELGLTRKRKTPANRGLDQQPGTVVTENTVPHDREESSQGETANARNQD